MKKIVIIHGYAGYPDKNWFPWLKEELESRGCKVTAPAMPHTDAPQLQEWLPCLQEVIGTPDSETYLVGHSLGCMTALRYLESLPRGSKIGGALLVAGFSRPIHFSELNNFFATPLDYAKCKESAGTITCINSTNDEHVPWVEGEIMRDKLGAKLIALENGGHINQSAGFNELPIALEEVLLMMQENR
jgi:predicted alpha/beta hydrolase family esterase